MSVCKEVALALHPPAAESGAPGGAESSVGNSGAASGGVGGASGGTALLPSVPKASSIFAQERVSRATLAQGEFILLFYYCFTVTAYISCELLTI